MTAIREANQIGTLPPTTLVAYEADLSPIFDGTDARNLAELGLTDSDLASADWRVRMLAKRKSPTQKLAERLTFCGFAGMQVRSFARGATATDLNLVIWVWGSKPPTQVGLVDAEGRLG